PSTRSPLSLHDALPIFILDGEIVALDDRGRPSFQRLQRRMHVASAAEVRRRMAQVPVAYLVFDLLYLDSRSIMGKPYTERRERLDRKSTRLNSSHVAIS